MSPVGGVTAGGVPTRSVRATPGPAQASPGAWASGEGTGSSLQLPMVGPSRRTLTIAGIAIALLGVLVGTAIAWRAFRRPASIAAAPPATVPETNVTLVELPHALPNTSTVAAAAAADGGSRVARGTHARPPATSLDGGVRPPASVAARATAVAAIPRAGTRPTVTASRLRDAAAATAAAPGEPPPAAGEPPAELPPVESPASAGGDPGPTVGGFREGGDTTDATGHMDPSVFMFVYRHYRSQIATCHANAARGHEIVGMIRVRIRLGEDGTVRTARIVQDTARDAGMAQCVLSSVRAWRYPQPEGGEVEFEYPFAFGN